MDGWLVDSLGVVPKYIWNARIRLGRAAVTKLAASIGKVIRSLSQLSTSLVYNG